MMLAPLAQNQARTGSARVKWVPAPTGGWNARDDLTEMEKTDAIVLDNVIVTESGCKMRSGITQHVTGLGSSVQSLMEYNSPSGTRQLFGATASSIFNVTTSGAVGAAVVSGLNSGVWSSTMFATAGGNFLVIANGADSVRNYDGTSWTTPTITGVTSSNLISVSSHMSRLWFVEKNSLKVWYLGTSAISGSATSIDFGPISRLGGELIAMTSWSRDGGAGIDDLAVFVTSRGEVHVYSGSDPSSATTWERVGTFRIGEPVGRRCFVKAGADVGVLTSQGLVPLSNVLSISSTEVSRTAATEKIGSAFKASYEGGKASRGWQVLEFPKQDLVLVNIPIVNATTYHQYVVSTPKRAWSRFTGINAECWGLLGDRLFAGGVDGTVYEYTGTTDNGANIEAAVVQAFQDGGTLGEKIFKRMKPQLIAPPGYRPTIGLRFDYDDNELLFSSDAFQSLGPVWDVAEWDVAEWGAEFGSTSYWQSVRGKGFQFAVVVRITGNDSVTYNGTRVMFEEGTPI